MSRKPKAIRLAKIDETESETKTPTKKTATASKAKFSPQSASKPRKTRKKAVSDRRPRVLPAPKADDIHYDPFDQKPFLKDSEQSTVQTHLPDMAKGIKWGSILLAVFGLLFSISFSLWVVEIVEGLFARHTILGWVAIGLTGLLAVAVFALLLREIVSIRKLKKLGDLRQDGEQVLLGNAKAKPIINRLNVLYSTRHDMHWYLEELDASRDDVMDESDKILLAEKTLLSPLDAEAKQIIASAAKRISVITALNPSAVLDVLFVGYQVLQMLRKLMALYGGRPAFFAAMKLIRMVATHLAVTGGLAISDTILQQVLGKGFAGTLSRKLGEGTVNGIMATRIGLAAIDLCRPLPFQACERPGLKSFISELAGGRLG